MTLGCVISLGVRKAAGAWPITATTSTVSVLLGLFLALKLQNKIAAIHRVAHGVGEAPTRLPSFYDPTYDYLCACGLSGFEGND